MLNVFKPKDFKMLKTTFLSNFLESCKTKLSCCRGTPQENIEAKLLDVVSYINYYFDKNKSQRLLHITETSLQLWSRQTSTLMGNLSFHAKNTDFELHYQGIDATKTNLGTFNPFKPSNRIASTIVNLLSGL